MGNLKATDLQARYLLASKFFKENPLFNSRIVNSKAGIGVLANQIVRYEVLNDRTKDVKIKVYYIDSCGGETQDCTSQCEIDGDFADTKTKEYKPNFCQEYTFKIPETLLRSNEITPEEMFFELDYKAKKLLDEWVANQVLLFSALQKGSNAFPEEFIFDSTKKQTLINSTQFNLDLVADLILQGEYNQLGETYILSGASALQRDYLNARFDAPNADGKGNSVRADYLYNKFYFDNVNFAKSAIEEDIFLISKGAIMLKTVNQNNDIPTEYGGTVNQTRYTVDSLTYSDVKYDAFYSLSCKNDEISHLFKYKVTGLLDTAPSPCAVQGKDGVNYLTNGILGYKKV